MVTTDIITEAIFIKTLGNDFRDRFVFFSNKPLLHLWMTDAKFDIIAKGQKGGDGEESRMTLPSKQSSDSCNYFPEDFGE